MRRLQEIHRIFIGAVSHAVDDACDTGIDESLGTVDAGQVGHVAGAAARGNAVQGGLDDGIRLGVNGANAMSFHHQVTGLIAMLLPGG